MIRLPEVNGNNWKKVLRELPIGKFPSLPDYLVKVREKLLNKEELLVSEQLMGKAKLIKYFDEFSSQINSLYVQTIDWDRFKDRPPYEHQKAGVEFLLKNNRCILGDDMGLGKSITCIYAALTMEDSHKILIVTLKSLKYNFKKEVEYLDKRVSVIDKKWVDNKFVIVNYDSLKKWQNQIKESNFSVVILDEAHKVRNPKAQRTKFVQEFLKTLKPLKIWLLTGTPIDNRPADYYNLLKMIKHPIAKNWIEYVTRYCDGRQNVWGQWETDGASNLEELHNFTKDIFLRRLKTNAGIDMTEKIRRPIFFELKNKKGYDKAIEDYRQGKFEKLVDEVGFTGEVDDVVVEEMTELMIHRQFCALEKINDGTLIELIENMMEESDSNKILVFTNFTKVVDTVHAHFGDKVCSKLDGRVLNPLKRLEIVDEFNNNPDKKVFVINQAVGSTGLNIQSANKVIVNDLNWVPSTMLQCEDRAWRIGQLRDVEVIYPLYDKTVEEVMYYEVEKKMRIISTVVEGKEGSYFEGSVLEDKKDSLRQERNDLIKQLLAQLD